LDSQMSAAGFDIGWGEAGHDRLDVALVFLVEAAANHGFRARAELHSAHPGLTRFGWSSSILS